MSQVPPGATIGILGGGQLGRMLAVAAAKLGYRSHIYAPEASGPAQDVCARWTQGAFDDRAALARFAAQCAVVTFEFENVAVAPLGAIEGAAPLLPPAHAMAIGQDRAEEKAFAQDAGMATAPYALVDDETSLAAAIAAIGTPAILKTRRMGYDGKGQARISHPDDATAAWDAIGRQPAVLEGFVAFDHEFSVLLARGRDGAVAAWDCPENVHVDGILATSHLPVSPIVRAQCDAAQAMAARLADALDYTGVMACEFFATKAGPVFNEMAPRVHNSGHWTVEGAVTSQFENHIRAICGLPLGSTATVGEAVEMRNLIGAQVDDWAAILADPDARLTLYGKHEAREGRKMGHVTRVAHGGGRR